jgi:hypothetical protein
MRKKVIKMSITSSKKDVEENLDILKIGMESDAKCDS